MAKEEEYIVLMEKDTTNEQAKNFIKELHGIGGGLRNPVLMMTDGTRVFPIAIPKEKAKLVETIPKVQRVEKETYFSSSAHH